MQYLLGIDLGTSATKTVLFDTDGRPVASASREYPLMQPRNGWAEQNPEDWWQAAVQTIRAVLRDAKIDPGSIAGIGFSGQMHGLVMLDENDCVIRPAILWCDGRTGEECGKITQLIGYEQLLAACGNPALTGFTAGKILWVKKNEPENFARCRKILLPKDYVRYMLCGVSGTDVTDASGTNLLDISTRSWSSMILQKLMIPQELLPPVHESCEIVGSVTETAAALTGLKAGTPVACGSGDNAAAAAGTGVVVQGKAFTTLGTSGVVYAHSSSLQIDRLGRVHTFCAPVPGEYALMSCTLAAGLSLHWFRDTLCAEEIARAKEEDIDSYQLLDRLAAEVPIGANGLLFLPYLMGERSPILDEKSRGVFFGLSAVHTKYDMLRAVMEGVVYSQRSCLDILREMHAVPERMLACGGGGTSPLWRQMLADNYCCPVQTVENREGPALGAALMAGVGAGIYPDLPTACSRVVRYHEQQLPDGNAECAYTKFYQIYKQLYPALKNSFRSLAVLR